MHYKHYTDERDKDEDSLVKLNIFKQEYHTDTLLICITFL